MNIFPGAQSALQGLCFVSCRRRLCNWQRSNVLADWAKNQDKPLISKTRPDARTKAKKEDVSGETRTYGNPKHSINVSQIVGRRRSSRLSVQRTPSRLVYARWRSPGNRSVKDLCTDSMLVMSATVNGDHTGVAYSDTVAGHRL